MREYAQKHRRWALRGALPIIAVLLSASSAQGQSYHYMLDPTASDVRARVPFFGLASKTAQFPEISGSVSLRPDHLESIDLDVRLDARALRAGDAVTLNRLKGPKFFDVEHYPTIHFSGRAMKMTGQTSAEVSGELTARGVTRPEVLYISFDTDPMKVTGREVVGLTGRMTINRLSYGMTAWQMIVGKNVTITIQTRMVPN